MKKSIKKSPYATFSLEPIKAVNPTKNHIKSRVYKKAHGGDLRAKGDK